jgi:hypothetical protein
VEEEELEATTQAAIDGDGASGGDFHGSTTLAAAAISAAIYQPSIGWFLTVRFFFFFYGHSKVSVWLPLLLFDLCIFFGSHYIFYLEMSHNVFRHV